MSRFCGECGSSVATEARYCGICGSQLEGESSTEKPNNRRNRTVLGITLAAGVIVLAGVLSRNPIFGTSIPIKNGRFGLSDRPSDIQLAQGIQELHTRNCQQEIIVDIMSEMFSLRDKRNAVGQVRDNIVSVISKVNGVKLLRHAPLSKMASTNQDVTYIDFYIIDENLDSSSADAPFKINMFMDPDPYGDSAQGIKIEGCPFISGKISIIDHDVDPASNKVLNVRYQESFKISKLVHVASGTQSTDGTEAFFAAKIPPNREGQAVWRKTDALGWRLESDSNN